MNWGKGIILSFVVFIGVLFTLVYISVNTEFSLVAENYYEQEINYEDQLVRIRNFNELNAKPVFEFNRKEREISLAFQEHLAAQISNGKVKFFRASGSQHDVETELLLEDEHVFKFSTKGLLDGAWTLQLSWSDGEKEFYKEIKFVI